MDRTPSNRYVTAPDGVRLAVQESGDPSASTVVAVHGYPDDHTVWDGVVEILSATHHVVTYDVRGAGGSDVPADRSGYRIPRLVADLGAVIEAVSPDAPVHLLAHDWGSIQSWPSLTEPALAGRIASYTSISGPSLEHVGAWTRAAHRHPRAAVNQLLHSYYIALFQLPGLPEIIWRSGLLDRIVASSGARSSSITDRLNGLELYRANFGPDVMRSQPRRTDVPVQVLTPTEDAFVSPAVQTQAPEPWVSQLFTRAITGGHWVVADRPDVVARCVEELIALVEDGTPSRDLQPRTRTGAFAGQLAVVTGGGRGIGRATSLELARAGADVIVADIDDAAAAETATDLQALGVDAASYHLDVSDVAGWESFADTVRREHGVPDLIVNNAGIGMAGPFLGTTPEQWEKIIGVNLTSVIHGSRLFAEQMVARGQGGQIVNVASAAAYLPSRTLPAYATTKAAVLMLTECLRAELGSQGIGVTAICPGFVDSDITSTTVHVGVDEARQAELRAKSAKSYGRRGYTPEKLARHLVRAAARNTPVAAISPESKLLRTVGRFAPALGRKIATVDLAAL